MDKMNMFTKYICIVIPCVRHYDFAEIIQGAGV